MSCLHDIVSPKVLPFHRFVIFFEFGIVLALFVNEIYLIVIKQKGEKMTLIKWNTTRPSIFNDIDTIFNSIASDFPTMYEHTASWFPKFEVLNMDNAYRIRADLPGMAKKDINIEVVNNKLTISGERKMNDKKKNHSYSEINYGAFTKSFNLPEDVVENKIKASMKDGVLALEIPRIEPAKPSVNKILIK